MTTIQTQHPDVKFYVSTETPTLAELRATKAAWLQAGIDAGTLEDCRQIAREFGARFEREFYYPWDQTPAYRWTQGPVRIEYFTDRGESYLPGKREFETREIINVFSGDHQVAHFIFTNNPRADLTPCFFVPGNWEDQIRPAAEQANNRMIDRFQEAQDAERRALLAQLLVGVTV